MQSYTAPAPSQNNDIEILKSEISIRRSLVRFICDSPPHDSAWLRSLTPSQWKRLLRWLDLSGLALYFFDQVSKSHPTDFLPEKVIWALRKRQIENTQRTRGMIAESILIQREFQNRGLRYAVVKGLSLWPSSVPTPELRLQFDLDYLIAAEDLQEAQNILTHQGYLPRASSEKCWKFIRNEQRGLKLGDIYKDTGSWVVELHDVPSLCAPGSPLLNLEQRELFGLSMPTLTAPDIFLRQGLHAYKDVCSQFLRVSLLVEFCWHTRYHHDDEAFWTALREKADDDSQAALALGVVALLISEIIGEFAPAALTRWTVDRLPRPIRLWVTTYGQRIVLGGFPGTRLYRLLEREIQNGQSQLRGSPQQSPVASRSAVPIRLQRPKEPFLARIQRFVRLIPYRMQLELIPSRLRFYGVEGLRLAWETHRWRRLLSQEPQ